MRIVIDLQAAQSHNGGDAGIGEASLAISRAMAENAGAHEIWIALNGDFPETIEPLRALFVGVVPPDHIRVWSPPAPVAHTDASRNRVGEFIYEAFLASLSPDAVLITNLFEGFDDRCFTSIGAFERQPYLSCVLLHKTVPVRRGCNDDAIFGIWREKKLGHLRRADVCLALSDHGRKFLTEELGFPSARVVEIGSEDISINRRFIRLLNEETGHSLVERQSAEARRTQDDQNQEPIARSGHVQSEAPGGGQSISLGRTESAKAALAAIEDAFRDCRTKRKRAETAIGARKRLAYISPIPPLSSGIADYSSQLVPELCRYYDIDLITTVSETTASGLQGNCRLKSPDWFDRNADLYERTIYHIGNSPFHNYMFELLERHPGVVVLHDFYLGHVMALPNCEGAEPHRWRRLLRDAHGYKALAESLDPATHRDSVWKYPVNLDVLHNATGIIVHSEYSRDLAREWYGDLQHEWRIIPLVRCTPTSLDRQTARARLGYKASDYLVCSFGGIGEAKLNREAVVAWVASTLARDPNCHLCFVGWKGAGDYGELFNALVSKSAKSRIKVTDTVDAATYINYLSAADCAIQLRTLSRGETSAAALDSMAYGLPLIANANGSMKELPADAAAILADDFTVAELTDKLEGLYRDSQQRRLLGQTARDHIRKHNNPRKVADLYFEAIEDFSTGLPGLENRLVRALGALGQEPETAIDWLSVAQSVNHNHRREPIRRRIFVDVTEVAKNDLKTGIERVVRNTVNELLRVSGCDYLVTPVYFDTEGYWRRANRFVSHSFMSGENIGSDDVVDIREGDIFFMLDLTYHSLLYFFDKFVEMRNNGVRIYICVYDILPIKFRHYFPSDAHDVFSSRFDKAVTVADGLVCISKTVANEVHDYLRSRPMARQLPLSIGWFHLGSDLMSNPVKMEAVGKHERWLSLLENRETLLMVGTVEPRKGHNDALGAFEQLWS